MTEDQNARSARLNVRLTPEALATIREAAEAQQQDLTSFVLGATMERARAVLAEQRLLQLSGSEVSQLEAALAREPQVVPELAALFRRLGQPRVSPLGESDSLTA